jgi:hypothetical protein
LKSTNKGMAIAGLVMSGIGLILCLINAIFGALGYLTGTLDFNQFLPPELKQYFS